MDNRADSPTDHRAMIAAIPVETRARLTQTSDVAGLRHLALHLAVIAAFAVAVATLPLTPLWQFGLGMALVFLFTLLHETTHRTPFRSLWLNRTVGRAVGILLFLPATWFHHFHMAHHRHTQIPGKDPELASAKPDSWPAYLWHLTGLPVWAGQLRVLGINALGRNADSFVPDARRAAITTEARGMLAFYLALLIGSVVAASPVLLTFWIVPLLLGQPVLRLYLLAEHGRCPHVANMLENSRTTLTNRAVRMLAWNMPFHAEHHSFPTVPFHNLPALHDLTRGHLRHVTPGYAQFHRDYARDLVHLPETS
ncbi:fatty acid desaturase [Jannaschia pohangensis]|uniref:Fatty acid desaturase n=1 Tax=Jannaschia pohangensis TaxID=390807 RepID=A0A1I3GWI9_9RHOB|nr:fatty acid desaturase [Jannaschia pohangensis]SFI27763.1 Fatty acid desaturase [Jannaschia pohangensis]